MRRVPLIAVTDEYDSAPGLAIKGAHVAADFMADRDGRLLTHDVLEHLNGPQQIGSVWDECEALGAYIYVRGQFGGDSVESRYRPFSLADNLAADLSRMFGQWRGESCFEGPHARTRCKPLDHWIECELDSAMAKTRADARTECESEFEEDSERAESDLERYLVFARERFRYGYRKAARRYRNADSAFALFETIKAALVAFTKRGELFEGAEYVLEYGRGRARVYERGGRNW